MKAIIAVNNLGFIGLKDGLPWKCKEDFSHFKRMTLQESLKGNLEPVLLVGYRTAQTLPPLKGRSLFLPPRKRDVSLFQRDFDKVDWCIGGKATYERFAPLLTELHISYINDNTIGDCTFPDLSNLNPNCKIYTYHFDVDKEKV